MRDVVGLHDEVPRVLGERQPVAVDGHVGVVAVEQRSRPALAQRAVGGRVGGLVFAGATVPTTTAWALLHPRDDRLIVFPNGTATAAQWQVSVVGWAVLAAVAAVVLAAALADAPW